MQNKNTDVILKNSSILVTGGAGFIGSNIIEKLLKQNNKITCLDNFSTGKRKNIEAFINNPDFILIEGDISNFETCNKACENIDLILHQAALGSVPRSVNDPIPTNKSNIDGFLNILTAAKDKGIKRFVYASSSSVYGDSPDLPKIEDKIGNPLSPYAITKYTNELYAKVFGELYNMQTIGLRYFNVFGKNQDPDGDYAAVFPKFIKLLINHRSPTIFGDGTQSRDFTYIENVVQANELAATTSNKKAINTVFNIACGESKNLNEITERMIKELSSFDHDIALMKPQYGPTRPGDIKDSLASIEKAAELLDYKPKYNVFEGLRISIEWYYKNLA